MKVLQFIPSVNVGDGGTTTYMQQLTACLGKLCELHVCAMTPLDSFVPLENCQTHSIPKSLLHLLAMKRAWINLLDEIQPDVVHINCCWLPQIALVTQWTYAWKHSSISTLHTSLKIILTPHGMLEPWIIQRNYWTRKFPSIWLYQRRAVKQCDLVVATAEEERKHLLQLGWNTKVALVQNGIDVEAIEMKKEWKKPEHLLFMSRLHPKKGLELLLYAMCEVRTHFHLTIAGSGEKSYVFAMKYGASDLGVTSKVSFIGPVYGDAKWALLREADALVLPSYSENYGLIVAEALACGTPVITTTGTPWKSIADEGCGWWVNPDDKSIACALQELSEKSEEEIKTMSFSARRLAERDCAISQKVYLLYNLYLSNRI